ncbi:protein tesmin/TSO1-like CXC 7 [Trifolium pratense]|uniref:protein tesmin/TSO1-like CXC 7 n=1 Tax=Trifolium pratense TaxID=57577 RepID=UPI001E69101A|nr:protein tesmin/TSO1-like CXC 7 [Trifolium pratense]
MKTPPFSNLEEVSETKERQSGPSEADDGDINELPMVPPSRKRCINLNVSPSNSDESSERNTEIPSSTSSVPFPASQPEKTLSQVSETKERQSGPSKADDGDINELPMVPPSRKRCINLNVSPSNSDESSERNTEIPSSTSSVPFPASQPEKTLSQVAESTEIKCDCCYIKCDNYICRCRQARVYCSPLCTCSDCQNKPEALQLSSTSLPLSSSQVHSMSQGPALLESHLRPSAIGVQTTKEFAPSLTLQIAGESSNKSILKEERICKCRKTKCLSLVCPCLSCSLRCTENCECAIECMNKEGNEALILQARMAVGCSCSKTSCKIQKCSCFQVGVGCSLICTCQGCENIHGRKDRTA